MLDIDATANGAERDPREGLPPDSVVETGSPTFEALDRYMDPIDPSDELDRLGQVEHGHFLVSAHHEENSESDRTFRLIDREPCRRPTGDRVDASADQEPDRCG